MNGNNSWNRTELSTFRHFSQLLHRDSFGVLSFFNSDQLVRAIWPDSDGIIRNLS